MRFGRVSSIRLCEWTEIHHLSTWATGGKTDLENAIGLCHFHHQRIHDPAYHHELEPDGIVFRARKVR